VLEKRILGSLWKEKHFW